MISMTIEDGSKKFREVDLRDGTERRPVLHETPFVALFLLERAGGMHEVSELRVQNLVDEVVTAPKLKIGRPLFRCKDEPCVGLSTRVCPSRARCYNMTHACSIWV